jgi:hypothetical protein
MPIITYPYYWRIKKWLPERWGRVCRIVARGSRNSILVEFLDDGYQVVTSGWFLRKRPVSGARNQSDPTPDEIAQRAAKVRADRERNPSLHRRHEPKPEPWTVPVIAVRDLGLVPDSTEYPY